MSNTTHREPGALRIEAHRLIDDLDHNHVMDVHAKTIRKLVRHDLPEVALKYIEHLRDDLRLQLRRCDQLEEILREIGGVE